MNENDGQAPGGPADNPYAPPGGSTFPPPPAYPPPAPEPVPGGTTTAVPKVMGVLSIVFGSLMLMGGLFGSCTSLLGQGMSGLGSLPAAQDNPELKTFMEGMGTFYTIMGVQNLVIALMSALLLAIGIGQVKYRQWASAWSMRWALAALALVLVFVVISFAVIGPLYQEMMSGLTKLGSQSQMPFNFGSGIGMMMGGTAGFMTIFFLSPYPILMLIFFSRPHVKLAMAH